MSSLLLFLRVWYLSYCLCFSSGFFCEGAAVVGYRKSQAAALGHRRYKTFFSRWIYERRSRRELCVLPPGQERFISMTRIYYKGALGCVVMFDVTSSSSFLSCRHWKQDLDNKAMLPNGESIPCILLANKVTQCSYCIWSIIYLQTLLAQY